MAIMNVQDQLRENGLKTTNARQKILDVLQTNCAPYTAEEIFHKLKKSRIDRATVYRNVERLAQAGILRKVDLHKNATYYEHALDHHHHIICTSCGTLEDFHIENCNTGAIKSLSKHALRSSKKFSAVSEHSLEFFGYCKECSKI
jgi:Fe2+ or Zn2+ uptake regulation protein